MTVKAAVVDWTQVPTAEGLRGTGLGQSRALWGLAIPHLPSGAAAFTLEVTTQVSSPEG